MSLLPEQKLALYIQASVCIRKAVVMRFKEITEQRANANDISIDDY